MEAKMKKNITQILVLTLAFCLSGCEVYNYESTYEACQHYWLDATCTEPQKCSLCGETQGYSLGHYYSKGYCTRCSASDPNYVSRDSIFPGTPTLKFYMNSAGGIEFYWKQNYTGDKKIDYITVTYTLYDAVGNPTRDDIKHQSTLTGRLIGPFEANEPIEFDSQVIIYCDVCSKISFDSLYLEYSDGTTATVSYGWSNKVRY